MSRKTWIFIVALVLSPILVVVLVAGFILVSIGGAVGAGGDCTSGIVDAQPVFEVSGRAAVARRALGAGEVWFLDVPEIFENAQLGQASQPFMRASSGSNNGRDPATATRTG